jgi:hypothetical protein
MMFIGLRYLKEPQDLHNVPFGAAATMHGTFRGFRLLLRSQQQIVLELFIRISE